VEGLSVAAELGDGETQQELLKKNRMTRYSCCLKGGKREWLSQILNPLHRFRKNIISDSREHILGILESDSEESARLRSSSPFTGILTDIERKKIFSFQFVLYSQTGK